MTGTTTVIEPSNIDGGFVPDWTTIHTATEAEYEYGGFKFLGPGWYITSTDVMLVMAVSNRLVSPTSPTAAKVAKANPWKQKWAAGQKFHFYHYSCNPHNAFNAVANAPVRLKVG